MIPKASISALDFMISYDCIYLFQAASKVAMTFELKVNKNKVYIIFSILNGGKNNIQILCE